MGVLPDLFDPATYSGTDGGLLARLPSWAWRNVQAVPSDDGAGAQAAASPPTLAAVSPRGPQAAGFGDVLDRIGQGIADNSGLLMGIGAGLARPGGSLGLGLQLGAQLAQQDAQLQAQRRNIVSTYQTLRGQGARHAEAMAAALNPVFLRPVAAKYFGTANARTAPEAAAAGVPPAPSNVPAGSAYSESRQLWRTPDGTLFDLQGNQVR